MVLISFKSDSEYQVQGFQLKYEIDSRYPLSVLHSSLSLWEYNDSDKNYYSVFFVPALL
jgi:hypothetical protein